MVAIGMWEGGRSGGGATMEARAAGVGPCVESY